jgi:hypothetical protein
VGPFLFSNFHFCVTSGALDVVKTSDLATMDSVASDSDIDSPGPEGKALSRIKTRTGLGGHMAYGDKSKHEVQDYTDALAENVSGETRAVGSGIFC